MSDKRISEKNIINIAYRIIYMIPMSLAIIAECRVTIGNVLAREEYSFLSSAAQGGIYAGMVLSALIVSFLISLVVTLSKWTKLAGVVTVIVTMLVMLFMRIIPERLTVTAMLWLIPVVLTDIIRGFAKKENEMKIVFLLPFLLISFLMLNVIPISEKPLDWSGVVRVYERIAENSKQFWSKHGWSGYDYGGAQIGFDGSSTLFKKLKSNNDAVMEVSREYPSAGAVYLVGKIYSDFDGREWTAHVASEGETEYSRMMDTIETRSAIEETYPYNKKDVYSSVKVDVSFKDMRTQYVLAPSKMVVGTRNSIDVQYDGDSILFEDTKAYGFKYSVNYFMLNRNGEDLIKYHREISEKTWKTVSINNRPNGGTPYSYEDYLNYREWVKETYSSKPNASAEVCALIEEITKGAETDYEKLCKIEEWLSAQIYSLDVDNKGKGIDSAAKFLDCFLLQDTKGYCSYYATAFVLMARELGMPARYVQGYRIPSSNMKSIVVSSNMAHAWAEVYFEGVGWIRFEPTPGYGSTVSWGFPLEAPEYYEELAQQESVEEDYVEDNSVLEEVVEEVPYYDQTKKLEEEARLKAEAKKRQQIIIIIIVATLAGLLIIAVILISIRLIVRSIRYRKMSKEEKIVEMSQRCLLVLDSLGKRPEQGETLTEYAERVKAELGIKDMSFIDAYEHILYRNGSNAKVSKIVDNYYELKQLLRGRKRAKARISYAIGVIFERKAI